MSDLGALLPSGFFKMSSLSPDAKMGLLNAVADYHRRDVNDKTSSTLCSLTREFEFLSKMDWNLFEGHNYFNPDVYGLSVG